MTDRLSYAEPAWLWGGVLLILCLSGISPQADRYTWLLETLPVMIGLILLAVTWRGFPLTPLTYRLLTLHALILILGGYYTYAEVPLFDWVRDWFDLERNNYDKVGHLAQGFVPAIIARELFIRKSVVNGTGWRNFLIVCFCLGFSAFYELIEWWVAVLSGESAEAFLGTQGYVWDTQSDMALALSGAIMALLMLSNLHDTQLKSSCGT